MAKHNLPFIHFAGGAWLNGKGVAVYGNNEVRELRAETCGGKRIPGTKEIVMTVGEYEELHDQWANGGTLHRTDARITQAALAHMGAN